MTNILLSTPSTFTTDLLQMNNLACYGFYSWAIQPGMGFHDSCKWWGNLGTRPIPHEGIDLYIYKDIQKITRTLKSGMLIPAVFPGQVVTVLDDFVARTVVVSHAYHDGAGRGLHTLYAHIDPDRTIKARRVLSPGEFVGQIAEPLNSSKCPAHLHLSAAWIDPRIPDDSFGWENYSNDDHIIPVDPLPIISP